MRLKSCLELHSRPVVIARYLPPDKVRPDIYSGFPPPQSSAIQLQVALLPEKISPSGRFIRLGDTRGDEIVGWTNIEALEVLEVLGVLAEDGTSVLSAEPATLSKISEA